MTGVWMIHDSKMDEMYQDIKEDAWYTDRIIDGS